MPSDVFRKIDGVVEDVDLLLGRVDVTLGSVDTTLADATAVLGDVRDLLVALRVELGILDQVPAMAAQLDEIHRLLVGAEAPKAAKPKKSSSPKKK